MCAAWPRRNAKGPERLKRRPERSGVQNHRALPRCLSQTGGRTTAHVSQAALGGPTGKGGTVSFKVRILGVEPQLPRHLAVCPWAMTQLLHAVVSLVRRVQPCLRGLS